jgi:beta-phosphoglucomutase-like phosphatase (HAD superfamily)
MRKVRAVLFDFDGVLADTGPLISAVASQILRHAGVPIDAAQYDQNFHGIGGSDWRNAIESLCRGHGFEPPPAFFTELQASITQTVIDGLSPTPGIISLWHEVIVLRGIVSSCPRNELAMKINKLSLYDLDASVAAEDVTCVKPDPEPYLVAATLLQTSSADCIVIEDSVAGVLSAKRAGAQTILLGATHCNKEKTDALAEACQPDYVAYTVVEFRNYLRRAGVLRNQN